MLNKEKKLKIIETFRLSTEDTGSARVQVALLTEDIKRLTEHCDIYKKDFSTRRGLLNKVSRRKKFLSYIAQQVDEKEYERFIQQLGIRK